MKLLLLVLIALLLPVSCHGKTPNAYAQTTQTDEIKTGFLLICDKDEQVTRWIELQKKLDPIAAIRRVNEEVSDSAACSALFVRFTFEGVGRMIENFFVTRIYVSSVSNDGYQWMEVKPSLLQSTAIRERAPYREV